MFKVVDEAENHDVILLNLGEQPYTETGNIESLNLDQAQVDLANAAIATEKPVILLTWAVVRVLSRQLQSGLPALFWASCRAWRVARPLPIFCTATITPAANCGFLSA
jgi:hypothetical protein